MDSVLVLNEQELEGVSGGNLDGAVETTRKAARVACYASISVGLTAWMIFFIKGFVKELFK